MLPLTSHNVIQFASLIIYALLIAFTLYFRRMKPRKLFLIYLLAAAGMSLSGLLMDLRESYAWLSLWKLLLVVSSSWAIVAYAHFILSCTGGLSRRFVRLGYGWLAVTTALAVGGYFVPAVTAAANALSATYVGYVLNALVFAGGLFVAAAAYFLITALKKAADPEERNRLAYLLAGLGFMVAADIPAYLLQDAHYIFSNIGLAGNAIIITYTLLKYRLLDIQKLLKKWVTYAIITVCITLVYLALVLILSNLLRLLPPSAGIPALIGMVLLFAFLFNWIRALLDRGVDRLFYGSRYLHRKMLLDFAGKMSTFINIEDIANELLSPLVKVIRAKQVDLLLPSGEGFSTRFVARLSEEEPVVPLVLPRHGIIVRWLEKRGTLSRGMIEDAPEFSHLSPEEKEAVARGKYELLCPIVSKRVLVGILAIGPRQPRGHFSRDDIDLVATLAKESAVAIENAQIYSRAREKADTDDMTGLYNHRAFQERLSQQIEKATLSGGNFSLLLIDLDFFKTYNDIYGHMLGDDILREVGALIRSSVRATDIGARYGGDEFAVILLNTDVEGASLVAERIRQGLEESMKERGIMLTCSIGIAGWRLDGITREMLIQAADKALYAAKAAGRNRICLASRLNEGRLAAPEAAARVEDSSAIENIVYALAATVDTRDHYTYGHSKAVSRYATELAAAIGYTREGIKRIRAAGLLHDIGKLSIPDSILLKTGPLSKEEWEIVKHHPEMGVGILKYIVGLRSCVDAVLYHHERYDGSGYPRGLKGNDIPLDARIMAIADAFDAMTSERGYKERRLTEEEAIQEMIRCAGSQFDPVLVTAFVNLRRKAQALLSGLEGG